MTACVFRAEASLLKKTDATSLTLLAGSAALQFRSLGSTRRTLRSLGFGVVESLWTLRTGVDGV
jgi:hypothetical protein